MPIPRFLTDSPIKKELAVKALTRDALVDIRKKERKKRKLFSDENKIETVKTYLALGGNSALTAATLGIHVNTLALWRSSDWWKTLVNDIKKQEKLELSAKTKNIIDRSLDLLTDRIDKGDFFYDMKKGAFVRKPISAKELNKISVDMIQQKNILDKATEEQVQIESTEDKLLALAERFAQLAEAANKKQTAPIQVTDVIFVEEKANAQDESSKRTEGS